ncbi:MAG: dTMP kinase [Solirubrobacteraceae bacterium]
MTPTGRLITIEGVDGAGKSTLAEALAGVLGQRGLPVSQLREPGGVQTSEVIRAIVKDTALTVGARTEALLYAAARAQLVEQALLPRLAAGEWVLLDRFVDSSLAYQGAGRGLGVDAIRALNLFATGGLTPDRTLLLDVDRVSARRRAHTRGQAPDRLEREGGSFFEVIASAYLQLAAAEPERFRVLDASRAPQLVLSEALAALSDLF